MKTNNNILAKIWGTIDECALVDGAWGKPYALKQKCSKCGYCKTPSTSLGDPIPIFEHPECTLTAMSFVNAAFVSTELYHCIKTSLPPHTVWRTVNSVTSDLLAYYAVGVHDEYRVFAESMTGTPVKCTTCGRLKNAKGIGQYIDSKSLPNYDVTMTNEGFVIAYKAYLDTGLKKYKKLLEIIPFYVIE